MSHTVYADRRATFHVIYVFRVSKENIKINWLHGIDDVRVKTHFFGYKQCKED